MVVLAACKGGSMTLPEECPGAAKELVAFLRATPHSFGPVVVRPGSMVTRTDLPPPAPLAKGLVVQLDSKLTWFDGKPVDDLKGLFAIVRKGAAKAYYLQIAPDIPWTQVVATVELAASEGYTHPSFAFEVKPQPLPPPPPRAAIDPKLDKILADDENNRASNLAMEVSKLIESCPSVKKVFGAVGGHDAGDKADILIEGLGEALPECQCSLDMASLRSAMWRVIAHMPDVGLLPVDVGPGGEELALPATMPWSEASAKLKPTTTRATFKVAP